MGSIVKAVGLLGLGVILTCALALAPIASAAAHGGNPGGSMTYGPTVRGEVTQVSWGPIEPAVNSATTCCIIQVNGHPYNVSIPFWQSVEVGDIVNFDGVTWSIVQPFYASAPDGAR